jgi:tRNA (cytidine/uridine-2'-O-)-methyltransferase
MPAASTPPAQPHFNVVLVYPQIPPNTGNVGRLCVGANCRLHLVEPLAFSISDKAVRRAGLDYWPDLHLEVHPSWRALTDAPDWNEERAWFFTSKARTPFAAVEPQQGDWLVFGRETTGLPAELKKRHAERLVGLPQFGPVRSMNLSNAAAVAVYQGLVKLRPEAFRIQSEHEVKHADL